MTHQHVPDGGGSWAVTTEGGRKRVLGLFPATYAGEHAMTSQQVEAAARLIVLALDMAGGVDAAIRVLREQP